MDATNKRKGPAEGSVPKNLNLALISLGEDFLPDDQALVGSMSTYKFVSHTSQTPSLISVDRILIVTTCVIFGVFSK